jgi:phosphatidylserine/phosphatidylglycerophosphate/cardiolipin synthase-like enzyme
MGTHYPATLTPLWDHHFPLFLADAFRLAKSSALIVQYQFRIPIHPRPAMQDLIDAIRGAADRGVLVRILLNHPSADNEQRRDHGTLLTTLAHKNIDIRYHNQSRILHTKCAVLDVRDVFLGSHNFSQPSFAMSRNLSAMIHCPPLAANIEHVYALVWKEARLATGPRSGHSG